MTTLQIIGIVLMCPIALLILVVIAKAATQAWRRPVREWIDEPELSVVLFALLIFLTTAGIMLFLAPFLNEAKP